MGIISEDIIKQFQNSIQSLDDQLQNTFENLHQGYPVEALVRFLKARDGNIPKAHQMLVDCLEWRIQNEIDDILSKPIVPVDFYRGVRDSQLIGMSGYTKEGRPVFTVGVGLSTYDKASIHYYVQSHIQINEYRDRIICPAATKKYGQHIGTCIKILDMTGLTISQLSQLKLLTVISSIDDLNYPEMTDIYYIVNAPFIFSACWKVVKPLLQERTRKKVQVLSGCGKDELLKIMDYDSLPHFCKSEGSGSGSAKHNRTRAGDDNCFSLDHGFHQELYNYINQQAEAVESRVMVSQKSFHVAFPKPDPNDEKIAQTIESELQKYSDPNGVANKLDDLAIKEDEEKK
ncbi:putative CRAL-TRIO lipid binding domain, CRAL/TRIO domain, CRAL/TRIO domain superfamily [Helianthus debilis subsp. tardiflorus]